MVAGESSRRPEAVLSGLQPGTVVSGYRLESRIGSGGLAVVFRARDERLGRLVALKFLAPGLAGGQQFRERFVRESRAAAAVDHPHIIPLYFAGEARDVLYLAMRYVPGGDLRSMSAREGPLPAERVALLLSPIAAALDTAHAAGLVHRAVQPANVLVDTSPGRPDHPYLADFGLVKRSAAATRLTGTRQYLGTPHYAAPEQIAGLAVDARADQYALACLAYTLLTGQRPFEGGEPMAVLWAHVNKPPPPVTALRPDLPARAGRVLARALAKAPADRFGSCGEFAGALVRALGAAHCLSPAGPALPAAPRPVVLGRAPTGPFPTVLVPSGTVSPGPVPPFPSASPVPPWSGQHTWAPRTPAAPGLAGWPAGAFPPWSPPHSGGWPAAPDTAVSPGDTASWPATGRRRRRRTWLVAVAGIAAAAGIAAGLLVARARPVPVPRPTALTAVDESASAVDISWRGPATGPQPDHYEIFENDAEIGTIPGTATSYRASGLDPATVYRFAVQAVRGDHWSAVSAILATQTATPSLSAAVLDWTGAVTYQMRSAVPAAGGWDKAPGDRWQDSWTFSANCAAGPCGAHLSGSYARHPFAMTLAWDGTSYTGSAPLGGAFSCAGTAVPATLSVSIAVSAAGANGTRWAATAFSGQVRLVSPVTSCTPASAQLTVGSG